MDIIISKKIIYRFKMSKMYYRFKIMDLKISDNINILFNLIISLLYYYLYYYYYKLNGPI